MKFNYDKDNDILAIHKGFSNGEKFKGNMDVGELILDVSNKGRIRGIEVLDASKYLGIKRNILSTVTKGEFNISQNVDRVLIGINLKCKEGIIPAKIAVPVKSAFWYIQINSTIASHFLNYNYLYKRIYVIILYGRVKEKDKNNSKFS